MALHNAKKGQDSYEGKQWGIINKDMLEVRPNDERELSKQDVMILKRRMRKWTLANRGRKVGTGSARSKLTWGMGKHVPEQLTRGLGAIEQPATAFELHRSTPLILELPDAS